MERSYWLIPAFGLFLSAFTYAQSEDPQSRSGPEPPPGTAPKVHLRGPATQHVIGGVPGYLWRHGCGPTSVGMVIGYYDTHGYSRLIPGDATTQTSVVNQAIASQGSGVRGTGTQLHYENYALPMDSGQPAVITDSSATYPTNCHVDNCIADFMQTSWSSKGNFYGWGYGSRVTVGFTAYVNLVAGGYSPTATSYSYSSTWTKLVTEVNSNRPMVFLVDSDGDGDTDHFVTVIGYDDGTPRMYGCLDTWEPASDIRWCEFRSMSSSYSWGVNSSYGFRLYGPADPIIGAPANAATRVSTSPTLSWSNGGAATSFDVYLGANATLVSTDFRGNQAITTYSPTTTLDPSTTYYWRIDAKNSFGTISSDVWSFTTAAAADFDGDGDADQVDLAKFRDCMTATGQGPPASGCLPMDLDHDNDVDQSDFGLFQRCMTPSGGTVDPNCMK